MLTAFIERIKVVSDIGIIGGADGPTAILVSRIGMPFAPPVISVIALAVSIIGICKTGGKK